MARAKRTDRAEARRRYRAELAGADGVEESVEGESPSGAAPTRTATKQMSTPPGRLGVGAAFRLSIHPINVRADLMALPKLVTHKALLIPVAITLGSTALVLATGLTNFFSSLMYTYFVQTPAIGGAFLGGFLAPRASWLIGAIVGLLSAICYAVIIISGVVPVVDASGQPVVANAAEVFVYAAIVTTIFSGFLAAGAAWYRRFLQLSNPNRGRRAAPAKGGAGGKGRSRSSGAAKTR